MTLSADSCSLTNPHITGNRSLHFCMSGQNVLISNDELSEDANQDAPRGRTRAGSRGTGRSGARGPGGHHGQRNRSGTRGGRVDVVV